MNITFRQRIAANILYKFCPQINIKAVGEELYDLVCDVADVKFAIKVNGSTVLQSKEFNQYIETLKNTQFWDRYFQIPIAIMAVNESTEEARISIVLGWQCMKPIINRRLLLQRMSDKTWAAFIEAIKVMSQNIRALSFNMMFVVKKISIYEQDYKGRCQNAQIIYLRRFTDDYKIIDTKVNNENEKTNRMMYGIPQEEYPKDDIDKDIFSKVKEKFSSAKVESSLLLFSSELKELLEEIGHIQYIKTLSLAIEPDIDEMRVYEEGTKFTSLRLDFKIYVPSPYDEYFFNDEFFTIVVPKKEWKEKYKYYRLRKDSIVLDIKNSKDIGSINQILSGFW